MIVDASELQRDLYLLLACALASKRYAELTCGTDYDTLQELRDAHEQPEIGRLLLSLAVRVRVLDDRGQISLPAMRRPCGSLTIAKNTEPLTLREACNKVVHARTVQLTVSHLNALDSTLPSPTSDFTETTILLHGSKHRKTWRAALDMVKFVRAVAAAATARTA